MKLWFRTETSVRNEHLRVVRIYIPFVAKRLDRVVKSIKSPKPREIPILSGQERRRN